MGLDTTHDCWQGPYSSFSEWRHRLANAAGMPPLDLMEGFYGDKERSGLQSSPDRVRDYLPIKWGALKPDVLHELLNHSDCDGSIRSSVCGALAVRLCELAPLMPEDCDWRGATERFAAGLRLAAAANEDVEFH